MACVIIQRQLNNPAVADTFYLSGTGFGALSAATSYSSKEAAMVDAQTLRDAGGNVGSPTAILVRIRRQAWNTRSSP